MQAIGGSLFAVYLDLHLIDEDLLFGLEIDQSRNALQRGLGSGGVETQLIEVGAEDFHRNLRAHTREQMIKPVRNGLADVHHYTGDLSEFAPNIVENLAATTGGLPEVHVDLGVMDAFGVLIEFSPAGAPARGDDLRHAEQQVLRDCANTVRLNQRGARRRENVDGRGALVEVRQKQFAHPRVEREGAGDQH